MTMKEEEKGLIFIKIFVAIILSPLFLIKWIFKKMGLK